MQNLYNQIKSEDKMAYKVQADSFEITSDTKEQALTLLLTLAGLDIDSFSSYMGKTIEEVQEAPQWAENYLKDVIDLNFVHLGYIMKDTKTAGLMGDYNSMEKFVQEHITNGTVTGSQPVKVNANIITEDGSIKASYLVHATDILKDFIASAEA